jgi:hypothetical protein
VKARDWTGAVLGRAVVLHRDGSTRQGTAHHPVWLVRCGCGELIRRRARDLKGAEDRGGSVYCDACLQGVRSAVLRELAAAGKKRWFGWPRRRAVRS